MDIGEIQGTVTLHLDTVTPMIRALCGGYLIRVGPADLGRLYIQVNREREGPRWDRICFELRDVAAKMRLVVTDNAEIGEVLTTLITRFPDPEHRVAKILEKTESQTEATWDDVFELAQVLDDGHGLTDLEHEWVWHHELHGGQRYVFGVGAYVSCEARVTTNSSMAFALGCTLSEAVRHAHVRAAAGVIRDQMMGLLLSIRDVAFRTAVADELSRSLFCPTKK